MKPDEPMLIRRIRETPAYTWRGELDPDEQELLLAWDGLVKLPARTAFDVLLSVERRFRDAVAASDDDGALEAGLAILELTHEYRRLFAQAAKTAEHLLAMTTAEQWRATGGDDGQGHYEGDYHAEQVATEIRKWKELLS